MKGNNFLYSTVFVLVLLALLAIPLAFGEDVTSSVTVGPANPVVSVTTVTPSPVDLSTCGTVTVWCNATITDANGWNDIQAANATLWDITTTTEFASDNSSDHYTNSTCVLGSGSGSVRPVNCTFTVQYYANNATSWNCRVYANDSAGASSSNYTNFTVNPLIAMDAENTIDFQSLSPGATSPDDVNNTVTNCGNVVIDLNLSGTNLTNVSATVTNISVGNVKYNLTDYAQDYTANMTSLNSSSTYTDFSLVKRTNGVSTNKTYWKISIPASIENLVYTGTITFTAVTDS
ncbi:MAG: hypothetical protein GTN38_02355 [Candidatus Aenigmarchaeota archaeon]|nr:hypothetical protein [Candidatus Aenigmarchaeota archaeon]NIP40395.1 hypothetical protein [Candidatus Aenigmarchaeota archaeon]NIQ18321.1 hypothetical protein [Candidatus Aenigmarchaeota archaeon]NIS73273.1 hypothetical protein [Candidatus Aenigmarchaeota archaeon]